MTVQECTLDELLQIPQVRGGAAIVPIPVWQELERRIRTMTAVAAQTIESAIKEVQEHNREDHHTTSAEKVTEWMKALHLIEHHAMYARRISLSEPPA